MSYRYFTGSRGRRFCYGVQPIERCPLQPEGDDWRVPEHVRVPLVAVGLDPVRLLRAAHRTARHRDDGRCPACGSRLERVGWAVWAEALLDDPIHDEAAARQRHAGTAGSLAVTRALNERLGYSAARVPGSGRTFVLKREAIQWAREQAADDKASAREEART